MLCACTGTEQAPQPASKQPFDSHSLIADLKRRFVLEEDGNGSESFLDEGHSMRTPLCMLGGMVSPHLRKAQVILCLCFQTAGRTVCSHCMACTNTVPLHAGTVSWP